jgi:hypothetical protein
VNFTIYKMELFDTNNTLKSKAPSVVLILFILISYLLKTQKRTDFGPQLLAEALIFSAILWCQNQSDILPESHKTSFSRGLGNRTFNAVVHWGSSQSSSRQRRN